MTNAEWTVRGSGRFPGKYYIDLAGRYQPADLAALTGVAREKIEALCLRAGASSENEFAVPFFDSREAALGVVRELETLMPGVAGKTVFLTTEELDYLRQALINEGSNVISVRNEIKRRIFDKFNA
jgi:hypothetical protein